MSTARTLIVAQPLTKAPAAAAAFAPDERINPKGAIPFALMHLACFGALLTGVQWQWVAVAVALYVIRMFGITAGYHRYFAHRSFKTSRALQFVLAVLGCAAAQKGPLWWAAHHRVHHKESDGPNDVHSPRRGFWWSHLGWILCKRFDATDLESIADYAKYPELRFLNRHYLVAPTLLAVSLFAIGGWGLLVVGFFWSTVALYHGTFTINSLCHVWGSRRFKTSDDSRNNFWLALLTLGEGWHNNHHHYQLSARQGFFWWEIDLSYYAITALERLGLVWDVRRPTAKAKAFRRLDGTQPLLRGISNNGAVPESNDEVTRHAA